MPKKYLKLKDKFLYLYEEIYRFDCHYLLIINFLFAIFCIYCRKMEKSKLLVLLSSLSRYDLNRFKKFVTSPFFNENREVISLFDVLSNRGFGNKTPDSLKKRVIWKDIFGRLDYNDAHFRRLSSELLQLLLDFMLIKHIFSKSYEKDISLLPLLTKPSLEKHFESVLRRITKKQEKEERENSDFFLNQYFLEKYEHKFGEVVIKKGDFQHFEKADYYLDCFYVKEKINHYVTALIYGNIRAKALDIRVFPDFLTAVKNSACFNEPVIKIYYQMALLFVEHENENHFKDFIKLLDQSHKKIAVSELREMYFNAQNYCAIKINSGNVKYYIEAFFVFQKMIEKKILGVDELDTGIYKNIITLGLTTKEFDWVESFIKNFTQKLPKEDRDNALTYNLAKVFFHQKQYGKVVDQLREVEYVNPIYALGAKLMLLKTYYEMGEDRALFSLMDSFSVYLRRNKFLSKEVKQQYLNVIRFLRKLNGVIPRDKEALQKLKGKVEKSKALADKQWLLEKIEEMVG